MESSPLDLFFADLHTPCSEGERQFLIRMMELSRQGHLCFDIDQCDDRLIREGAETVQSPYLHKVGNLIYLKRNYAVEKEIVEQLKQRMGPTPAIAFTSERLTEEQSAAVRVVLSNRLSVIEGGPGTGKTFLTQELVRVVGPSVILAAPTGKAAARLKAFNPEARCGTVHALIGYPSKKRHLKADLIVIDESSMIDASLLAHFLRSISVEQRVVFLGDGNQLPPIESGTVFNDFIDWVPTAHLRRCLRSDRLEILQLARDILEGKDVEPHAPLTKESLLKRDDVTLLTPLREGPWGVEAVNQTIRSVRRGNSVPILITKTDYELGLYNGELGTLWLNGVKPLYADFDGRHIAASHLPPYELAYAITIHKSQGSEFDHVMVLIPPGSENFGRELLYTAVTRAKLSVTLCGDRETIQKTVARTTHRTSGIRALS